SMLALLFLSTVAATPPCAAGATRIEVRTREHALWLCEDGRAVKHFAVALGRGGSGKRTDGDGKTPLGSYALGAPRPSAEFGLFIPVGYPTEDERRRGFSGGAIGIHGPKRAWRWLGRANLWADWTRGCVALATDDHLRAVADWIRRHPGAGVRIRE